MKWQRLFSYFEKVSYKMTNNRTLIKREQSKIRQLWQIIQSADTSALSPKGIETSRQLDRRRQDCQTVFINDTRNEGAKACEICRGYCCYFGHQSLYYFADVWVRRYTDRPTPSQDEIGIQHPTIHFCSSLVKHTRGRMGELYGRAISRMKLALSKQLKDALKSLIRKTDFRTELKEKKAGHVDRKWIPCKNVTGKGCILDPSDRPITCIVAACDKYIDALHQESLVLTARNLEGLRRIHQDLLDLLKKEKKLGKLKGLTRIALSSLPFVPPDVIHKGKIF